MTNPIDELRDGMVSARAALAMARTEIDRLRRIENAAMRVAGSRRDGIVLDIGALDRLDAALESTS